MSQLVIDRDEFDLVVIGTGTVPTLIAAAAAVAGKSVLNLDFNEFYGNTANPVTLNNMRQWPIQDQQTNILDVEGPLLSQNVFKYFCDVEVDEDPDFTEELDSEIRHYLFDKRTRLMFSTGALVEIFIKAKLTDYLQFNGVDRLFYCSHTGKVGKLPISKSDIFQSSMLSLQDKRTLMKFLHQVVGPEVDRFASTPANQVEDDITQFQTFEALVSSKDLPDEVKSLLLYGVAHASNSQGSADTDLTVDECMERFKRVMFSAKRYGKGCFIYPLYGTGGISEAMSRKCAIYGGVQALAFGIRSLQFDADENLAGVVTQSGQFIKSSRLVIDNQYVLDNDDIKGDVEVYSHCVLIADAPLDWINAEEQDEYRNYNGIILIPPEVEGLDNRHPIQIVQLDKSARVCPPGKFIVYITTLAVGLPREDLEPVLNKFYRPSAMSDVSKPYAMWKCFYRERIPQSECVAPSSNGIYCCNDHTDDLSFASMVVKAEKVFKSLFPDETFFPDMDAPVQQHEDDEGFDLLDNYDFELSDDEKNDQSED